MKKRIIAVMMATMMMTGLSACGNQSSKSTSNESTGSVQASQEHTEEGVKVSEETNEKLKALVDQENSIYSEYGELWEKVLGYVDNEKANKEVENGKEYMDILKEACEKAESSLSEEELKMMQEDLKKIVDIETQIKELTADK